MQEKVWIPARPPPAPACFARHHTPQHAIAWQGLCNVGVYRTHTQPQPILQTHGWRTAIMQEGYGLGAHRSRPWCVVSGKKPGIGGWV